MVAKQRPLAKAEGKGHVSKGKELETNKTNTKQKGVDSRTFVPLGNRGYDVCGSREWAVRGGAEVGWSQVGTPRACL